MAIIKISDENMDKITKYNLIRGNGAVGLKNVDGSALEIAAYVVNELDDENLKLTLVTTDGEMFFTASQLCIRDFLDICEVFGNDLPPIEFFIGRSKNGRDFLSCRPAMK